MNAALGVQNPIAISDLQDLIDLDDCTTPRCVKRRMSIAQAEDQKIKRCRTKHMNTKHLEKRRRREERRLAAAELAAVTLKRKDKEPKPLTRAQKKELKHGPRRDHDRRTTRQWFRIEQQQVYAEA